MLGLRCTNPAILLFTSARSLPTLLLAYWLLSFFGILGLPPAGGGGEKPKAYREDTGGDQKIS